jgi:hypothetical protein
MRESTLLSARWAQCQIRWTGCGNFPTGHRLGSVALDAEVLDVM